jgi:hypothetical protein
MTTTVMRATTPMVSNHHGPPDIFRHKSVSLLGDWGRRPPSQAVLPSPQR